MSSGTNAALVNNLLEREGVGHRCGGREGGTLSARRLGVGTYVVQINIGGVVVGTGQFSLK